MLLIRNATIINEGQITPNTDVLVNEQGRIAQITPYSSNSTHNASRVIDATGLYLMPGVIDTHVHFREPGLTSKADMNTESAAAVAGGTTSIMDMPNTTPQALTQEILEQKYEIASTKCISNYSFYMGLSNANMDEVLKTDNRRVCALKVFMCHSTGNMKVDESLLDEVFSKFKGIICTHCEDEPTIIENSRIAREKYGDQVPWETHADIRSEEACVKSTELAIRYAKKHNARLHVVHLTSEKEIELFSNDVPLSQKRITCEVAPHHLWFDTSDYAILGSKLKCNPAVKEARHKKALLEGLLNDKIDMIATDHAPHLLSEKNDNYWNAPSGIPLIQNSLNMLLQFYKQGKISLEKIVEKMCHSPAQCFQVEKRGYIREGYWADLTLFDLNSTTSVTADNLFYKCKWSPFEGYTFDSKITHTIVSGQVAFENGAVNQDVRGQRLLFERD
jgi:dihydroorotase